MNIFYNNDEVSVCYKNACVHTRGRAAKVITWVLVGTAFCFGAAIAIKSLKK